MFPVTVIAVKPANVVILFCGPADNVVLNDAVVSVPGTVRLPIKPVIVLNVLEVTLPVTVISVNPANVVILFCGPDDKVVLNDAAVSVPGTVRLPIKPVTVLNVFDVTFPVAVIAVKPAKVVMLF